MKENLNAELSDYIKLERFKAKKNQQEIADILGVSRNTYCKWEMFPSKLDLETLIKIGNAIGTDILIFFKQQVAKCNEEN